MSSDAAAMTLLRQVTALCCRRGAGALLVVITCAASTGSAQSTGRVGKFVTDAAPRPPLFPAGSADCQSYSDTLSAFQRDVSARHQSCLDTSDRECPDDRSTGCECHICAPFHGSVSQEGVSACYKAVRDADARIDRVNQVLSSAGTSSRELLARHLVEHQIRLAMGDSSLKLLDALGLVSAVARSNDAIVRELIALQGSVSRSDPGAPLFHVTNILQRLSRHGLAQNPVALLMTDIALEHVSRMQGDALLALEQQLSAIRRDLESQYGDSRGTSAPAVPTVDCRVLADEGANRALKETDPEAWLALVGRCAPQ
jgi:hypothetical protein